MFLAGFECSCQRLEDGRRLDLLGSTRHRELVDADYARLRGVGIASARDGVSWTLVARPGGRFDFGSVLPMLRAAERHGLTVIWDLMHFGWPDDVDVFAPTFPRTFARYATAFVRWFTGVTDQTPFLAPINEISFLAWGGGDVRCLNPFQAGRGPELKQQLVRGVIEAIDGIRAVAPHARFLQPEPVICVHPCTDERGALRPDGYVERGQDEAWDMLTGAACPSLGGDVRYLDVVGVNFYPRNQFTSEGATVWLGDPRYRPFHEILLDVWQRYRRPVIVSETGTEGEGRGPWIRYVAEQCIEAIARGCDLLGITVYPVVDHPGWADDRHCENGLFSYADGEGYRQVYEPLLREIERFREPLASARRAARMTRS